MTHPSPPHRLVDYTYNIPTDSDSPIPPAPHRLVDYTYNILTDSDSPPPPRLIEDTYTLDEVVDMFDGLLDVVSSEVDGELMNATHTNVLLLRQLFQQAEKWHLKLTADISELENRLHTRASLGRGNI